MLVRSAAMTEEAYRSLNWNIGRRLATKTRVSTTRQHILQLAVLVFECPQPFGIRDIHPAELGLPVVQRRFRHPVLPAEFPSLRASLMLPQHCDDLFFRKPASLHRSVPCSGRTLTPRGGISQWQVRKELPMTNI